MATIKHSPVSKPNAWHLALSLVLVLGASWGTAAGEPTPASLPTPVSGPTATPAATSTPAESATTQALIQPPLTRALIKGKIKEIEALTDQDEAAKAKLVEPYRKALTDLEAAAAYRERAAAYSTALASAPEEVAALRAALAKPEPEPSALPPGGSVRELEQALAQGQAEAAAVATRLGELDKELENAVARPAAIRTELTQAKRDLADLGDGRESTTTTDSPEGPQALARRAATEARRFALREQVLMLDQELASLGLRVDLMEARRDVAEREQQRLNALVRTLEEQLGQRRREGAEQAAAAATAATREAAGKHPALVELARRNADLGQELAPLTEALDRITGTKGAIESLAERTREALRTARARVELAGLTRALGQVLLDQRNRLPDARVYAKAASDREQAIADASLRLIRYGEERRQLRDVDAYLAELVARVDPSTAAPDLRDALGELARQRKALLEQASGIAEAYLLTLGEVDHATRGLLGVVAEYDAFLAERLLWVRSHPPIGLAALTAVPAAFAWLLTSEHWREVGRVLVHGLTHSPTLLPALIAALLLWWKSNTLRRLLLDAAAPLRRVRTDRLRYTMKAVGITLLLAAPWSLVLAAAGWQLTSSLEATDFTRAVGRAALSVASGLYYLRAFAMLCLPGGVADRHFRWPAEVLPPLRRGVEWLIRMLVPFGLVAGVVYFHPESTWAGSLGRLALVAVMLALAAFFARLLHPRLGVLRPLLAQHPEGWLNRLRHLWYPALVAQPAVLGVLALLGYVYTAGKLLQPFLGSLYLLLVLIVVKGMILRWLVLTRRRLALQAALDRHAARAAEAARAAGQEATEVLPVEEPTVDFASLDEQTRRLVDTSLVIAASAGLWGIWSAIFPAFGVLNQVALWHYTQGAGADEQSIPVTLGSLALVALIVFVATVAARNLPGLLEIMLLQTKMSAGSRYTVKTLTGYTIVITAVLLVASTLGFSWGKVQWLVAALGVGIGFGLQEVVANFVSGLIILFERPVRVGDIITVGDTSGVVSKIQIRATTIRNWDKQELLVPNKELITSRLLNWTLSDQMNRVVVTVGVDYGSDVPRALELLAQVAREHPRVLDDPAPLITFEGFGSDSLTLVLRCYLASLDYRLSATSELHLAVLERFRANGIGIAFPQRDVHLWTQMPLEVRIGGAPPT